MHGGRLTKEQVLEFVNELSPRLGFSYFGIMYHLQWEDLDIGQYLRFTAVRHPRDRALSFMYYRLCVEGSGNGSCDEQYRDTDLSGESLAEKLDGYKVVSQVLYALNLDQFDRAAADELDFIFVTDRMDESLVAFKILYGLSWQDVVQHHVQTNSLSCTRYEDMNAGDQRAVNKAVERLRGYSADVEFYRYASDRLDRAISDIDREFPGGGVCQAAGMLASTQG